MSFGLLIHEYLSLYLVRILILEFDNYKYVYVHVFLLVNLSSKHLVPLSYALFIENETHTQTYELARLCLELPTSGSKVHLANH
jgi:hypothetical protein